MQNRLNLQFISSENPGFLSGSHGGTGISQWVVAKELASMGHKVEYLLKGECDFSEFDGVTIRTWGQFKGPFKFVRNCFHNKRLTSFPSKKNAFSIIPDMAAIPWPYPLHTKKVIKFTSTHLTQNAMENLRKPSFIKSVKERLFIPRFDFCFGISQHILDLSCSLFKVENSNVVIPNAVDTNTFFSSQVEKNNRKFLFVGTVRESKGLIELFEAMRALKNKDKAYRLDIIGPNGNDDNKAPDFMSKLKKMFPDWNELGICFLGSVPNHELVKHYQRSRLVILPTHYESFGRTTIEAMACGSVVIRSDAPPAKEIIEDGKTGFLFRTGNVQSLVETIERATADPEMEKRIGKNASRRAHRKYSAGAVASLTEAFLLGCGHV